MSFGMDDDLLNGCLAAPWNGKMIHYAQWAMSMQLHVPTVASAANVSTFKVGLCPDLKMCLLQLTDRIFWETICEI